MHFFNKMDNIKLHNLIHSFYLFIILLSPHCILTVRGLASSEHFHTLYSVPSSKSGIQTVHSWNHKHRFLKHSTIHKFPTQPFFPIFCVCSLPILNPQQYVIPNPICSKVVSYCVEYLGRCVAIQIHTT